jgi:hypothetical protein
VARKEQAVRFGRVLAILVTVVALVGIAAYVVLRNGPVKLPSLGAKQCAVTDGATTVALDSEQMANAATIAAVGIRAGLPERAVAVALATALQESKLRNLPGGDRDSVGLFQQRPSQGWGTPDQISDPRYAARHFYAALTRIRGWETMRITEAAQRVQRSAYPEAYDKWAEDAQVLAGAFVGRLFRAVTCPKFSEPSIRGEVAVEALNSALDLDWGDLTNSTSDTVGVVLTTDDEQVAWQYAHWLVAHSAEKSVASVRYDDQEWTAASGKWSQVDRQGAAAGERVVAEVYAPA